MASTDTTLRQMYELQMAKVRAQAVNDDILVQSIQVAISALRTNTAAAQNSGDTTGIEQVIAALRDMLTRSRDTTLRRILADNPDAVWHDGMFPWETPDILTTFEQSDLDRLAVLRDDTVYFLNPVTRIEIANFALRRRLPTKE